MAAGRGSRFKLKTTKILAPLASRPLFVHCLRALEAHPAIKEIILVTSPENLKKVSAAVKKCRLQKVARVIKGGRRRQDSVYQGLKATSLGSDLILIHDAARPFLNKEIISRAVGLAQRTGSAVAAVPVRGTIKTVKGQRSKVKGQRIVAKTLERRLLWEAQTPQVFKRDLILTAFRRFVRSNVTDDAALVEKLGKRVSIVMGADSNIKITTQEDLIIAEAIAKQLAGRQPASGREPRPLGRGGSTI